VEVASVCCSPRMRDRGGRGGGGGGRGGGGVRRHPPGCGAWRPRARRRRRGGRRPRRPAAAGGGWRAGPRTPAPSARTSRSRGHSPAIWRWRPAIGPSPSAAGLPSRQIRNGSKQPHGHHQPRITAECRLQEGGAITAMVPPPRRRHHHGDGPASKKCSSKTTLAID